MSLALNCAGSGGWVGSRTNGEGGVATPVFARCPAGCFARNYLSNSHGARCDAATNEQQAEQTDGKRGAQTEGERDRQWEWERAAYDRLRGEREVSVTVTLSLSVCPFLSFLAINHLLTDIDQINWYCLWLGGTISDDFRWGTEAIIIMLWQINVISFATKWDK